MSDVTALQNVTRDFVHTFIATQLASIFRLANGYIYVRLEGIDSKLLQDKLGQLLGKEGDLKTQITRGGLEIVFVKKS
ncbi:MAG: hypothetical protein ACP5MH_10750 [Thermoproteus sp.]